MTPTGCRLRASAVVSPLSVGTRIVSARRYRHGRRAHKRGGGRLEAVTQRRRGALAWRIAACGVAVLVAAAIASQAQAARYVVLYKHESVASDAAATIKRAGGSMVASYPQIGVVIAESDAASFANSLSNDSRVEGAASTAGFGVQLDDGGLGASVRRRA